MQLEEMSQFFNTRVDTYEEHMRTCVDGANEYYEKTAAHFPERGAIHILDPVSYTHLDVYKRQSVSWLHPCAPTTTKSMAACRWTAKAMQILSIPSYEC